MTIIMRKDLGEKKILEISATSRHGSGTLYVTSMAISYEVDSKGIYLNFIPRGMIKKFTAGTMTLFGFKKFHIIWSEDNAEHSFEFRTKQYKSLQKILNN